jgi:hypothetical protein
MAIFQKSTAVLFVIFALINFSFPASGFASQPTLHSDTLKNKSKGNSVRTYKTEKLSLPKPVIDGVLDDACWQSGVWAGDFTQWIPKEGAKPSQPTEVKVIYDDKNIYVAIKAWDSEPDKIQRKAGRRDEFEGDGLGICFDSYHDHRTGFEFDMTAAGQKLDAIVTNPGNSDFNWNAVWDGKVSHDQKGWYAEMRIPLSQLRYSSANVQVWGLHVWRWINRLQEESDWEPQSSTGPGILYLFGELHGIEGLQKSKRFELMPYSVGKLKTFKKEPENPYTKSGKSWDGALGLDAKIGVSSNFTLDLTINPDFGQVEADPSVMNLTAFESFFEEKRPFFLEGKNIFNFDVDDFSLFYSRRIGQSSGYDPEIKDKEYKKMPDNTAIYTAEKFSGKTANGLTVGVIHSITAEEKAKITTAAGEHKEVVSPITNYLVGRIQKDFDKGNTVLGGIVSSVKRLTTNPHFDDLNRTATTGGLDFLHYWKDKEYFVDVKLTGSQIHGKSAALLEVQQSSAHYFQRPDAAYLDFDSTMTSMSGFGGKIKIGKGSKGLWRYSTELNWKSPGLELNDLGYMPIADLIKQVNNVSYFVNQPVSIFRTYNISLSEVNSWNFGGNYLGSNANLNFYYELKSQWGGNFNLGYGSKSLDTRLLRGGNAVKAPPSWSASMSFHSDWSKRMAFSIYATQSISEQKSCYHGQWFGAGVSLRPINTFKLSMNLNYTNVQDEWQYVDMKNVDNKNHYVLAKADQQSLGLTFRADYHISPELSIQYYGSPFAASAKFSNFKEANQTRSNNYSEQFSSFSSPKLIGNNYQLAQNVEIENPDQTFAEFKSNFVIKWEYRPGSSLYLVWSGQKSEDLDFQANSLGSSFRRLNDLFANNLFLVKFNYWFSI